MPPDLNVPEDPKYVKMIQNREQVIGNQSGREVQANRENIKLENFNGDSSKFRRWANSVYSYIFNTGLVEVSMQVQLHLLDRHLPIGSAPQKSLESSTIYRECNRLVALTFSQERMLLQQCYEPVEDPTHLMTHMNQLTWNGKAETLGRLIADVEYGYNLSNPQADCTVVGVLQILQKIGVKNIALLDAVMKMLSDNSLAYNYTAVQRAAEDWMRRYQLAREASGQISLKAASADTGSTGEDGRQSQPRGRSTTPGGGRGRGRGSTRGRGGHRDNSVGPMGCSRSQSPGRG